MRLSFWAFASNKGRGSSRCYFFAGTSHTSLRYLRKKGREELSRQLQQWEEAHTTQFWHCWQWFCLVESYFVTCNKGGYNLYLVQALQHEPHPTCFDKYLERTVRIFCDHRLFGKPVNCDIYNGFFTPTFYDIFGEEELAKYNFQNDFMKPFLIAMRLPNGSVSCQ